MQTDRATATSTSTGALWASAFVIGALIIAALGRGAGNAAHAGLVSQVEDYTIMTFDSGNDEAVAVLDLRTEDLLIYQVENRNRFEFVTRASLSKIFQEGQRVGAGK